MDMKVKEKRQANGMFSCLFYETLYFGLLQILYDFFEATYFGFDVIDDFLC